MMKYNILKTVDRLFTPLHTGRGRGWVSLLLFILLPFGGFAQEKIVNPDISYAGTPRSCEIGGLAVEGVEGTMC